MDLLRWQRASPPMWLCFQRNRIRHCLHSPCIGPTGPAVVGTTASRHPGPTGQRCSCALYPSVHPWVGTTFPRRSTHLGSTHPAKDAFSSGPVAFQRIVHITQTWSLHRVMRQFGYTRPDDRFHLGGLGPYHEMATSRHHHRVPNEVQGHQAVLVAMDVQDILDR